MKNSYGFATRPAFSRRRSILLIGSFATFIAAGSMLALGNGAAPDEGTGCVPGIAGPVTVVLLDGSDPLGSKSQALVREAVVDGARGGLHARLILARFSGKREFRPEILFSRCDPGRANDATILSEGPAAREEDWVEKFGEPLEDKSAQLARDTPAANESYIADAIARVASDPSFHLRDGTAKLIVLSDFIENSDVSHPYRDGALHLPAINEQFLKGIKVKLIELPALEGAEMLQNYRNRTVWRDWIERAGAAGPVEFLAPGLAGPV
jgi:hypothetical protein